MKKVALKLKESLPELILFAFFFIALFNPVFKKYDYGAGFPLVVAFGVVVFVLALLKFRDKRECFPWGTFPLFIFGAAVLVSFILSETRNLGFSEVLAFLSMIPLYLLYAHGRNDWVGSFLKMLGLATVLACVLAYFFFFLNEVPRMTGPFFNVLYHANVWPNAFALYLLMSWPVFLILFKGKWGWPRLLLFSFVIAAVFLTFSRGAAIVLVGQAVLLLAYNIKNLKLNALVLPLIVLVLSVGIFFGANYLRSLSHTVIDIEERVGFENEEGLTSKQERIDFWLGAVELIKEKPLFGWGPFSFRQAYNPIQKTFLGNSDHPHNIFLKIGAENGLIALIAFLIFLFSIFAVLLKRWNGLSNEKKLIVYILGISVAGAFAHNLIDYNFNFLANLMLLFLLLAAIRSILVLGCSSRGSLSILLTLLALFIALLSVYEGGVLVINQLSPDSDVLSYSLYPRAHYLNLASDEIQRDDFEEGLNYLNLQMELNPLDAQAYYLQGVIYCDRDYSGYEPQACNDSFAKALALNPMNEIIYHREYFRTIPGDASEYVDESLELLYLYFDYVEKNVHFTAYTQNVEAAGEYVDLLFPYLGPDEARTVINGKARMLETAFELRDGKSY